mmetsp:Transcript_14507/g.24758  ORF Transcript_14507/g.24758 Transcript_14507/m.24758 type:complete len:179 (-) Transcript_14507:799-1335(-)
MLTPQGMRQRYLLGRYMRQKLVDNGFGFNKSRTVNFDEYEYLAEHAISTNLYRTIQSGYSEIIGFSNATIHNELDSDLLLTAAQAQNMKDNKRGTVKFAVRRGLELKTSLDTKSIVEGYTRIPIHTYMDRPQFDDDIETKSCGYVAQSNTKRWEDTAYGDKYVFNEHMDLVDSMRDKY